MTNHQIKLPSIRMVIDRLLITHQVIFFAMIALIMAGVAYLGGRNQLEELHQTTHLLATLVNEHINSASGTIGILAAQSPEQKDLDAVTETYAAFDVLYHLDRDGTLVGISPPHKQNLLGMDMSTQAFFTPARQRLVISSPFISTHTGNPTVYLSIPIANQGGMLVGELNLTNLQESVIQENISQIGVFYILDQNGYLLAHPQYDLVRLYENSKRIEIIERANQGREYQVFLSEGELFVAIAAVIPRIDWVAITQVPLIAVYGPYLAPAIMGLLSGLVLFIVIGKRERAGITRKVVDPLSDLSQEVESFAAGDHAGRSSLPAPAAIVEVSSLVDSFERMKDAVQSRQEALRESEERLRSQSKFLQTVLDSLTHPFYVIDARDRKVIMANAAAQDGHLRGEITCHALIHGNDHPCETTGYACPLVEVRKTKAPVVVEHIHLDKVGQPRYYEVHGFPIIDPSGEVIQMIEYSLDITERKLIENALAKNRANLLALIENASDRIWAIDKNYGLIECNAAFRQYLLDTYGVEFQTGDSIFMDGIPASVQSDFKSLYDRCLAGEKFSFERWTSDSTQKRCIEYHFNPIQSPNSTIRGLNVIGRDITDRKQIEIHRQELAALEERERIGRELHDDLGQVMSYVSAQAQSALERLANFEAEEAQGILKQLTEVAQGASANVRKYILGIRTAEHQPPVDFIAELEQFLDTQRQQYGLETQVSLPDDWLDSPFSQDVEIQLLRVIQEALTNVRKHAGVDKARLLFTQHANEVQVVIEDDGVGFEVVQPAGEATKSDKGHFGLTIMRERAESVGGRLEVRSGPGEGTCIILRLPRAIVPAPGEELARGVRVLLVDDHPMYLEGLRSLLAARGILVVGQAHDGLEALEKARTLRPDLILMDVQMPRCDGVEATRRIKAELPEVRIIMLTMAADSDTLFEAIRSGASGYLLKSLEREEFFSLLGRVIEGETALSPGLAARTLAEFARADAQPPAEETLTARQREVLELAAQGLTNREIAGMLTISAHTVKYHISQILERLQLQSRHELGRYTQQEGKE